MEWLTNPWVITCIVFGYVIGQFMTFWKAKTYLPKSYYEEKKKREDAIKRFNDERDEWRSEFAKKNQTNLDSKNTNETTNKNERS